MTTILIIVTLIVFITIFRSKIKRFEKEITRKQLRIISVSATVLIIVVSTIVMKLDKELYYVGRSILNFDNFLPFDIKPIKNYNFGSSFVLQKSRESLIGKGVQYRSSDLIVNKILKYGYNKKGVIAVVNDSSGKVFYVLCEKNEQDPEVDDLGIRVISKDSNIVSKGYKWIDPNKPFYENIKLLRNYLIIILLVVVILLFYSTYKLYITGRQE